MKRFVCSVCGYVHEGDEPPEECPVCHQPASKFKEEPMGESPEETASLAQQAPERHRASRTPRMPAESRARRIRWRMTRHFTVWTRRAVTWRRFTRWR